MASAWLLALAAALPAFARAGAPQQLAWQDLRPAAVAGIADPFAAMPDAELDALQGIVRIRVLEARGFPLADAAREQHAAWTRELEAKGHDVDALLARREAIMAQRRAAAEEGVAALDGLGVRIPGYLLPVAMEGGRVAEFVLVALPGACSHVAPPPANQVVRVRPAQPSALTDAYQAAFVEGTLRLRAARTTLHVVDGELTIGSAYAIDEATIVPVK
jgi:hypothetical protein